ncbi:MAG: RecX family transcriptional regulator [Chloroflexi bacterium]|nr:RecX family transcriptional regulator [Chloroflexota bacterium]
MRKVTAIEEGKGIRGKAKVFLDGSFAFNVGLPTVEEADLRVGQELSEAQAQELVRKDLVKSALDAALKYISFRPRSEEEVRRRLHRRKIEEAVVEEAILILKEQGVLDDVSFARFWRENRESFNPRGSRLLEKELRLKGIDPGTAKEATMGLDDEEGAYRAGLKKMKSLSHLDYKSFRNKLGAFLTRRGFAYSVVNKGIERLWQEVEKSKGCPEGRPKSSLP